jgi:type I restriction enzyme S subunit
MIRRATGASYPAVSDKTVKGSKIPLPSLPEQRRIAAILDKADAVRRKRQQTLDLADQFLRSAFLDMFGDPVTNPKGWPVKKLGSLTRGTDRINYGVVQPGPHVADGVPIVRVGDFSHGRIQTPTSKRISRDVESAYRRSRLAGDEILVACVGSIGEVAAAEPEMSGWNIVRAVARVPLGNSVEPAFVSEYLRTEFVQSYFRAETRTVSQPTLNIKQIRNTEVFMPPIDEQRRFARLATVFSAQSAHLSRALLGVTELTDSLTQRAFRGIL